MRVQKSITFYVSSSGQNLACSFSMHVHRCTRGHCTPCRLLRPALSRVARPSVCFVMAAAFTGDALHASKSAGRGRKRKLAADGRHFRSHLRELAVWRGIQHMGRPTIDPSRHKLAFEPFHHQTASYVANRSHLHEEQSYCLVRVNGRDAL